MASVRIIYDVDGWADHNRALALQKYAPPEFDVSIAPTHCLDDKLDVRGALGDRPADIVLVLDAMLAGRFRALLEELGWPSSLIVSWSVGWPKRIASFHAALKAADVLAINNRAYWDVVGRLPGTQLIENGVDRDIFRVQVPIEKRPPRILWMGSAHRGSLKDYDEYLLPLASALRTRDIDTDFVVVDPHHTQTRTPQQMAEWYNTGSVVVVTSDSEGTLDIALEGAACGCTVVALAVGNMPELIENRVNGYLVERTFESLLQGLEAAVRNYPRLAHRMQRDIEDWSWASRRDAYFSLFAELLEKTKPGAKTANRTIDLSPEVTVFVTTVGAKSFEACLQCLDWQDSTFRLEIIDRFTPMNAAFQHMADSCDTPYYVQVDEHMLLFPWAVRGLHQAMLEGGSGVALVMANLFDAHLQRCIPGVKIFRHEAVRRCPYSRSPVFEVSQVERLRADGHRVVFLETAGAEEMVGPGGAFGLHGTDWDPATIHEHYRILEHERRCNPEMYRWVDEARDALLNRVLENHSELDFFALMGSLVGSTEESGHRAEDYHDDGNRPAFEHLCRLVKEVAGRPDASARSHRDGVRRDDE